MNSLDPKKIYGINVTEKELIQLLSPSDDDSNKELFYRISGDQKKFNKVLARKGINRKGDAYDILDAMLNKIQIDLKKLMRNNQGLGAEKLDFDAAIIFHKHLNLPKRSIKNYSFWRYITLFYFIEFTKWRWEKNPDNPSNWHKNAKAVFDRAIGRDGKNSRNKRINSYLL